MENITRFNEEYLWIQKRISLDLMKNETRSNGGYH